MKRGIRKAVIDCGTNTFHLLIIELTSTNTFDIIHKEKCAVKIGAGIEDNTITSAAEDRALKTLSDFANTIKTHDVDETLATATSAFRSAHNSKQVVQNIFDKTGIEINIIGGKTEAQLIFNGVSKAVSLSDENSVIMDIGGGSVEFIICNKNGVEWLQSFEIGGIRLYENFHKHDPISKEDAKNLISFLDDQLKPLTKAIDKFGVKSLVGASGSFDTLSEIYALEKGLSYHEDDELSFELPVQNTLNIIQDIIKKQRNERLAIPGMIEMRAGLIVVAALLVKFVLEKYKIEQITTTSYALKEGLIFQPQLQELQ